MYGLILPGWEEAGGTLFKRIAMQPVIIIRIHSNPGIEQSFCSAAGSVLPLYQYLLFHNPAILDAFFIPTKSALFITLPGD